MKRALFPRGEEEKVRERERKRGKRCEGREKEEFLVFFV